MLRQLLIDGLCPFDVQKDEVLVRTSVMYFLMTVTSSSSVTRLPLGLLVVVGGVIRLARSFNFGLTRVRTSQSVARRKGSCRDDRRALTDDTIISILSPLSSIPLFSPPMIPKQRTSTVIKFENVKNRSHKRFNKYFSMIIKIN
jgi:hypothetical protein